MASVGRTPPIRKQQSRKPLAWEEINEPGAYVEIATGMLYRVPPEVLAGDAAPLVEKQDESGPQLVPVDTRHFVLSRFVRVSGDPYIFSLGARMICVEQDIQPHF
ncbi:MAG TPA: hypothetical protein VFO57_06055 [Burkholderiales bacterium]|nr:hypothetical protein [Burkholderiales bacterium]